MKDLNQLIKEYQSVCNELKLIQAQKDSLAEEIKDLLQDKIGKTFTTEEGVKASVVEQTRFTYDDNVALISYLTKNGLKATYITETIDTKKFNAELKKSSTLYDNVKSFVTKNVTETLKVVD